jgi:predicted CoA-binding protein
MNVAVIGASNKPQRYSYKAIQALLERGHTPYPVHPIIKRIGALEVYDSLGKVPERIDTVTMYLSAANAARHAEDIMGSGARRVIFNPGAENPELMARLQAAGIETIEACSLVLLATNQF